MEKKITVEKAVELISSLEGFKSKAYQDGASVWTIGYGSTEIDGNKIYPSTTCTEEQAKGWLRNRVEEDYDKLDHYFCIINDVILNDNQAAAILSFCYNCGFNNFLRSSIASDLINKKYDKVTEDLKKWDEIRVDGKLTFSVGLFNRRMAEANCFIRM